ncbi:uncharacterized protein [Drosophila pseudoobscura]|uniref:Uncharacterized protein isoform X2 n=1 Tax=Drosophila pseudoobscura pseudoobscura TaxID=46245 RepID=A0A0R3P1P9_DROPS|nr:uncharacterized protein LOC6901785 isoform X2 [Drosophila pseudoobscura]
MNPDSRMFVPFFILFALILATLWGLINRQGLIEAYHKQLHGEPNAVGVEWMDKLAQLTDPINAVVAMADKDNAGMKSESTPVIKNLQGHNNTTKPPVDQNSDKKKEKQELLLKEHKQGKVDEPQVKNMPKVRIVPDLDLRREFASDRANPYIDNINENYDMTSQ